MRLDGPRFGRLLALVTIATTVSIVTLGLASYAGAQVGALSAGKGVAAASCASQSSRYAKIAGGIVWAKSRTGAPTACARSQGSGGGTPPSPPYNGSPPLTFHGGPVTGTTTPGELTVTPVYWVPSGSIYSIPAGYETLINQFITDSSTDNGKTSNVFSTLTQYTNSGGVHISYLLHAGAPITDTDPYPTNGCTPDPGVIWSSGSNNTYTKCITDAQLGSEASAYTTAHSLSKDLAHLYMFFLPEGVETCFTSNDGAQGGACSVNPSSGTSGGFCGYHSFAGNPLYADMNYAFVDTPAGFTCASDGASNSGGNQSPNGNIQADTEISITSHETSETITDPQGTAWWDAAGNEIGDDCAYVYGDSNSFQGTAGAKYNQTINGHHYFIQTEFSNQDFAAAPSYSCIQSEDSVSISPTSGLRGAAVTVSGGGFLVGETVKISYKTGLASPASVLICSTTASASGSYSCSGHIPSGSSAGALGSHSIVAKGVTTKRKPKSTFSLT